MSQCYMGTMSFSNVIIALCKMDVEARKWLLHSVPPDGCQMKCSCLQTLHTKQQHIVHKLDLTNYIISVGEPGSCLLIQLRINWRITESGYAVGPQAKGRYL